MIEFKMALHSTSLSVDQCIWPVSTRCLRCYARFESRSGLFHRSSTTTTMSTTAAMAAKATRCYTIEINPFLFQALARLFQLPSNFKCR